MPTQCLAWLGFVIDLEKGKIIVPNEKLDALHVQLWQALVSKFLLVRSIASITGKIISMLIALGPVTRLMTKSIYVLIATRRSWCHLLKIPAEAKAELQFWANQLKDSMGRTSGTVPLLSGLYTLMPVTLAMVDI